MTPTEHAQLLRELADELYSFNKTRPIDSPNYKRQSDLMQRAHAAAEELEGQIHADASLAVEVWDLIGESHGVTGLHLNGDVAPWSEIVPGGRFERLPSLARFGGGEVQL